MFIATVKLFSLLFTMTDPMFPSHLMTYCIETICDILVSIQIALPVTKVDVILNKLILKLFHFLLPARCNLLGHLLGRLCILLVECFENGTLGCGALLCGSGFDLLHLLLLLLLQEVLVLLVLVN